MNLTRENYYAPEADRAYMSCSQYQGFLECEAKQMAKLEGRWSDKSSDAFLVGNYFHTYFEGPEAHKEFCEANFNDIYKSKTATDKKTGLSVTTITGKYKAFETADAMIEVAESDPLISSLVDMGGEAEKIMTGVLLGVPWRIRIDKYVAGDDRMVIDWKTTASIWDTKYNPIRGERETFVDTYGYMLRAAVYSEIEKQFTGRDTDPHFIIVAISKQEYPDKEVLRLNHRQRYDYELEQVKNNLGRIMAVKNGGWKPMRCGTCDYCRATKQLFSIRPYYKLMPEFRDGREEDYVQGSVLADAPQERDVEQLPPVPGAIEVGTRH